MHTYLTVSLLLNGIGVLAGLVFIARRDPPTPIPPTWVALRVFSRLLFCGWAIYLLAKAAA